MLKKFFAQPVFKDPQALMLAATGFVLLSIQTVYFSLNIQSQDIKVPIRYSGYDASLSDKGHWLSLFVLLVFGVLMYIVNITIGIKVYRLKRAISIWVLTLNIIVIVFLILVTRALLNLV